MCGIQEGRKELSKPSVFTLRDKSLVQLWVVELGVGMALDIRNVNI